MAITLEFVRSLVLSHVAVHLCLNDQYFVTGMVTEADLILLGAKSE